MILLSNTFRPATPETTPGPQAQAVDLARIRDGMAASSLPVPVIPAGERPAPSAPRPTPVQKVVRLPAKQKIVPALIKEPTVAEMVSNFAGALSRWVKAGAPIVPEEEFQRRLAVCRGCEHWIEAARLGLGKCNAPGCGCTKGKLWFQTETCPLKKW